MADNVYYTISKGQGKVFHYSNSGANKTLDKYTGSSNILSTGIASSTPIITYSGNLSLVYRVEKDADNNFLIASSPNDFVVSVGTTHTFTTNYLFLKNLTITDSITFLPGVVPDIVTICTCGLSVIEEEPKL